MFSSVVALPGGGVTIHFEGRAISSREGQSVAAALLEAGITHFRDTPASDAPRAPFCMMGACFDCLLIIDDHPDCQGCMTPVRDGMRIARQSGCGALLRQEADG